uniref:Uncharacterized protein n=1 Tax=Medicago truncatula TaxID=3880 RepID=A2Q6D7_MEDTR|nr:hypothetical protein MtrDRAFT_AC174468g3v1 [Medicago truncatula]
MIEDIGLRPKDFIRYGELIPVPAPLDKYDTRIHPLPSCVSTMRVPADIEVSMGTHEF